LIRRHVAPTAALAEADKGEMESWDLIITVDNDKRPVTCKAVVMATASRVLSTLLRAQHYCEGCNSIRHVVLMGHERSTVARLVKTLHNFGAPKERLREDDGSMRRLLHHLDIEPKFVFCIEEDEGVQSDAEWDFIDVSDTPSSSSSSMSDLDVTLAPVSSPSTKPKRQSRRKNSAKTTKRSTLSSKPMVIKPTEDKHDADSEDEDIIHIGCPEDLQIDGVAISSMTNINLRTELILRQLPHGGNKADLVARLGKHLIMKKHEVKRLKDIEEKGFSLPQRIRIINPLYVEESKRRRSKSVRNSRSPEIVKVVRIGGTLDEEVEESPELRAPSPPQSRSSSAEKASSDDEWTDLSIENCSRNCSSLAEADQDRNCSSMSDTDCNRDCDNMSGSEDDVRTAPKMMEVRVPPIATVMVTKQAEVVDKQPSIKVIKKELERARIARKVNWAHRAAVGPATIRHQRMSAGSLAKRRRISQDSGELTEAAAAYNG